MNRRAFLSSLSCTAALTAAAPARALSPAPYLITARRYQFKLRVPAELAGPAAAFARQVDLASGGRLQVTPVNDASGPGGAHPAAEYEMQLGTLHALHNAHPAFAYAAGLPGGLGLPPSVIATWLMGSGQTLWRRLQAESGITCLIMPGLNTMPGLWSRAPIRDWSSITGRTLAAVGLAMDVARGLGAVAVSGGGGHADMMDASAHYNRPKDYAFCAGHALQRFPSLMAVMLQRATWNSLDAGLQRCIADVALACGPFPPGPAAAARMATLSPLPLSISRAIDRVSEAVVATLSGHDQLSKRVNTQYFALHSRQLGSPRLIGC